MKSGATETPNHNVVHSLWRAYQECYQATTGMPREVRGMVRRLGQAEHKPLCGDRAPRKLPATTYLNRAIAACRSEFPTLSSRISEAAATLRWSYGYQSLPDSLARCYAFSLLVSPEGPVCHPRIRAGLVLFGPRCSYPLHRHPGIAEVYLGLAGSVRQNDLSVIESGHLLYNARGRPHRLESGTEPALLAYIWQGDLEAIHNPVFEFMEA